MIYAVIETIENQVQDVRLFYTLSQAKRMARTIASEVDYSLTSSRGASYPTYKNEDGASVTVFPVKEIK